MPKEEFAARVLPLRARLYRAAYLYLGSEAAALDAVAEDVARFARKAGLEAHARSALVRKV